MGTHTHILHYVTNEKNTCFAKKFRSETAENMLKGITASRFVSHLNMGVSINQASV